jgi:hypothetical protein
MQDHPVPPGITVAFQRLLEIYREYRNAAVRPDDAQSARLAKEWIKSWGHHQDSSNERDA